MYKAMYNTLMMKMMMVLSPLEIMMMMMMPMMLTTMMVMTMLMMTSTLTRRLDVHVGVEGRLVQGKGICPVVLGLLLLWWCWARGPWGVKVYNQPSLLVVAGDVGLLVVSWHSRVMATPNDGGGQRRVGLRIRGLPLICVGSGEAGESS